MLKYMKNFGILLKKLRTDANLTQEEFSCKLRTTKSTVSKWENGSSVPDTETILKLSAFFHISCDDLLHPTETLTHMASAVDASTSNPCTDSEDEGLNEESSTSVTETDIHSSPQYFIFTPKKILLLCMPILILGMVIGIIGSRIFPPNHTVAAVTESNEAYTLMEARNDVETKYGPAYEFIYILGQELSTDVLIEHANLIVDNWKEDIYTDATEDNLIISYYLTFKDVENANQPYFRAVKIGK